MTPSERRRIIEALDFWIKVKLDQQTLSTAAGTAQGGTRAAVTGGKHLGGVNRLILDEIESLNLPDLELSTNAGARLPGYVRATKDWDLLVISAGSPILAVEYKSMSGSEGKNLNNRADEVIGVAADLKLAQDHDQVPDTLRRAYIYLMEVTPDVTHPVAARTTVGRVDPVFEGASYLHRMAVMCERLRDTGLYDLTWAVGVQRDPTAFTEPLSSVGWDRFAGDLRRLLIR